MKERRPKGIRRVARFGTFELNLHSGELRKSGFRIRFQQQPFVVLAALLERPGELVEREELRQRLWPDGRFVDFEDGLTTAVKKIRRALSDSSTAPRFVETIPKRGYRFVSSVEIIEAPPPIGEKRAGAGLRRWVMATAAALMAAAVAVLEMTPSEAHGTAQVLRRLTTHGGVTQDPAVTPDGRWLAYASDRAGESGLDIWLEDLEALQKPVRLTDDPAEDSAPSVSADGKWVAFWSERHPAGIYVAPATGGEARLIAEGGWGPRFSPTSNDLVYWGPGIGRQKLRGRPDVYADIGAVIYVAALDSGIPLPVTDERFRVAARPLWSPDGSSILFRAQTDPENHYEGDWWVIGKDGKGARPTGLVPTLKAHGLKNNLSPAATGLTDWIEVDGKQYVYLSDGLRDSFDIWRVELPAAGGEPRRPELVTSGTSNQRTPRVLPDGRLLFVSAEESTDIWALRLDSETLKSVGTPRRLTTEAAIAKFPTLSADGTVLAYQTESGNRVAVYRLDLKTGQRTEFATHEGGFARPVISPSGDAVMFLRWGPGRHTVPGTGEILIFDALDGSTRQIFDRAGALAEWSPDGRWALHWHKHESVALENSHVSAIDVKTGEEMDLLTTQDRHVPSAWFSPDGDWLAFPTRLAGRLDSSEICVARFQGQRRIEPSEWSCIPADPADRGYVAWSGDGAAWFFFSRRDGHTCLYGRRLDSRTKAPLEDVFAVHHFHEPRRSPGYFTTGGQAGPSFGGDQIAFVLGELESAIWVAE